MSNSPTSSRVLLSALPVGVVVIDGDSIVDANFAAADAFGVALASLVGSTLAELVNPNDAESLRFALDNGVVDRLVVRNSSEQRELTLEFSWAPSNENATMIVAIRDVTELIATRRQAEELQEQLRRLATHDTLTGLPNRSVLPERLGQALKRHRRFGFRFALLYLDLDGFKVVNDEHGHDAGDAVLMEVAERLCTVSSGHGLALRVGGDEFVVIYEGANDVDTVGAFAARVIQQVVAPIEFGKARLHVGTSIGIAVPRDDDTIDTVVAAADSAMFAAKHRGKGCWNFADR
jgi:diguanylate cyclase (GGDEF)-like protein